MSIVDDMILERRGTVRLLFAAILLCAFLAGLAGGLSFYVWKDILQHVPY
jgi:hypothetical protein